MCFAKIYIELEKIAYFDNVDISNNVVIDENEIPHTATFTIACTYAE